MPFVDEAGSPAVQPQALTPAVIRNRLVERGWSQRAATGAAANFAHEAGGGADAPLNPGAIGDNGNAIGLPQWNGPRKRAYEEFAQSRGKDWRDVETQLDYLDAEMGRDFKGLRDRMDAAGSDEDAARLFVKEFERPADMATNLRVRGETARKLSAAQLAAVGPVGAIAERLRGLAEPAFRTQNTVGSAITRLTEEGGPAYIDRDFDPIGEALADPDLADHAESFIDVRNREHFQTRANIIRRENENRRLLDEGGAWGVGAQVLAGVIDPVNLLPVGGGAWRASRAANVALGAGRVGVGSALGAAASELALQATQETRTAEESAMTIGTSFVLGGVLGGLAGAMAPREFAAAGRAVDRATVPEATAVYDDVRSQLLAAGRGEAEADAGAGLWKAHVEAMAGITGKSPDAVFEGIVGSGRKLVQSGDLPSGMSSGFKPTHDWQEVPSDAVLPPGLEIRMDMESGRNMARVPPGQPLPAGVEETFAQSLSDMNPGMRDVVQQAMDVSDATGRQSWVWRNPDGTYAHELNGKPPVEGATLEGRVFGSAGAEEMGGEVLFQAAYHGSPHRFDKFSLDAIGTGEGAQAYGWGLYFAENKGVAESYRATLSRGQVAGWRVNGGLFGRDKIVDEKTLSPLTRQIIGEHDNLQDAIDVLSLYSNNADMSKDINTLRNIIKKKGSRIERGQLYKVDVPESDVLLDWDAPLVKQNEGVIEKLRESGLFAKAEEVSDIVDETTGEDLYKYLSVALGDDKSASLALRDAGIPGLKYFDGASRRSGDGSRNFVVFDDAAVKTLETFYQSGASDLRMEKNKTVEEFLNSLPDDFSKFHIDDAGLSKAESALLNALKDDDWLAYDSPRKAVEIALSDRLEDFAPSGEVRSAVKQYKADTQPAAAKSSERDVTETKEFKNWFGKSKVVDEYGRPLVVSHGSRAENISEFENNGRTAYGIFFTDAPETAKYYAGQHGKIYNVFLKAERPADLRNDRTLRKVVREAGLTNEYKDIKAAIDDGELYQNFAGRSTQDRIIKAAQRLGHDAVILPDYTPSVGVTNSYIVFSPEQIKSVDNAGSFSSLSKSMFNQDARGAVELGDGIARITLGAKADASTFLHESGHVFLHTLDRLANDSPELAADLAKVREWLGNSGGRFTVEQQEKWARGFEAYLREGKAPAPALQRIFDQFREWLAAIYRNLADLDVELSDDVRGVMDRLLGVDDNATGVRLGDYVEGGSGGAAAMIDSTLADEGVARGVEAAARAAGYGRVTGLPGLRLRTSESLWIRRTANELLSSGGVASRKNEAGATSGPPVEELVKAWQGNLYRGLRESDGAYREYLGSLMSGPFQQTRARFASGVMSREEFDEATGRAMRWNDDARRLQDVPDAAKPFVSRAAAAMRREVFDPLKDAAIDAGLLPPDVTTDTALSYLTRVYNRELIAEERAQFADVVTNWLRTKQESAANDMAELQDSLRIAEGDLQKHRERSAEVGEASKEVRDFERLRGEWKQANQALKAAERELEAINKRKALFTASSSERTPAAMAEMLNAMRTGRGLPKPPRSLMGWIREQGGLRDQGGELTAYVGDRRGLVGLLNDKSGMTLDDAALRAWEAGYLGIGSERPSPDVLMEALRRELGGEPVYARDDLDLEYELQSFRDLDQALTEAGVDLKRMTNDEAMAAMAGEKAPRLSPERVREIGVAETRAKKTTDNARARLDDIDNRLSEAQERVRVARERVPNAVWREERASAIEAAIAGRIERLNGHIESLRYLAGAELDELADIADGIIDQVTGGNPGRIAYEALPVARKRGPALARTFLIPDAMIERWLVNDVQKVARIYTRTLGPDVELAKRFGTADMADRMSKITTEYNHKMRVAKTDAERLRLDARKKSDLRDMAAMRDLLRSNYGLPKEPDGLGARAGRVARNINYLRLLGGMTIHAATDVARPVMVHGLLRTFGDGLLPMVRNFRGFRLASDEVKLAGTALDMVLDTRAHALYDVLDDYGKGTKAERALGYATSKFGVAALMSPWNATLKQFSGIITMSRMLRAITNYDGAKPAEITRLARLGIDREMADQIAAQFATHGRREGGVWLAGTADWTNRAAAKAFRAALTGEVDEIIVTPGIGDKPLWMSTEMGRIVGQFKSFQFSATQRVLLSGLQQRDAATLNGVALSLGIGALVYYFDMWRTGQDPSDEPAKVAAEAFDKSGLAGWLMDANNVTEKLTRGTVGVSALTGGATMSRFASRGVAGAVIGPTFGGVFDEAVPAAGAAVAGDFSAADTHRLRKLVPLQNLFYIRGLFDKAEEGFNDAMGVPQRRQ